MKARVLTRLWVAPILLATALPPLQASDVEMMIRTGLIQLDSFGEHDRQAVLEAAAPDRFGPYAELTAFGGGSWLPTSSLHRYIEMSFGYWRVFEGGTSGFTMDLGPSLGIPTGAFVVAACVNVLDTDSSGQLTFSLWQDEQPTDNSSGPAAYRQLSTTQGTGVADTPGYRQLCVAPLVTVRSIDDVDSDGDASWTSYRLHLYSTASWNLMWGGGFVWWNRQVSPAPATATFSDVPVGYWAFQHVEALTASGITAGCSQTQFCPDAPLTRAQMAIFLAKGLGLDFSS